MQTLKVRTRIMLGCRNLSPIPYRGGGRYKKWNVLLTGRLAVVADRFSAIVAMLKKNTKHNINLQIHLPDVSSMNLQLYQTRSRTKTQ